MIEHGKSTFRLLDFGFTTELASYPRITRSMNSHGATAPD